jgi:hypothetical protein
MIHAKCGRATRRGALHWWAKFSDTATQGVDVEQAEVIISKKLHWRSESSSPAFGKPERSISQLSLEKTG